eukprot:g26509.t1
MRQFLVSCAFLACVSGWPSNAVFADDLAAANRPIPDVVDHYIDRELKNAGVEPAEQADDATLIRRITLDLAGRIPAVVEVDAYVKSKDPAKLQKLIDRLIASPEFVERQAIHFDTFMTGGNGSLKKYLLGAFQENRSWDRVFRDVVTGDERDPVQKEAAAFLKSRVKDIDKLTNEVSVVFFGINVSCAKCHDHPLVEDWKQDHFYGMKSFFNRTYAAGKFLGERDTGEVSFKTTAGKTKNARLMFLTGSVVQEPVVAQTPKRVGKTKRGRNRNRRGKNAKEPPAPPNFSRREQLIEIALHPGENQFFAKSIVNRVWHQYFGIGLVTPLDQMHSANPPSHPELLDWLARDLIEHRYDLKRLVRGLVASRAYARSSRWNRGTRPKESLFAVGQLRPLTPVQMARSLSLATADQTSFADSSMNEKTRRERIAKTAIATHASVFEEPDGNFQAKVAYVGSQACLECHRDAHETYLKTAHSRALAPADPKTEPEGTTYFHEKSGRRYSVFEKDGVIRHRESIPDGDGELIINEYPVKYVIGSGHHSRSYLFEVDGFLNESPITWYARKQAWAMSPGYDRPDHQSFKRAASLGCVACHAGQVASIDKSLNRLRVHEQVIGCENCHGPGSLHVARRKKEASSDVAATGPAEIDHSIVNPAHLSRELRESVCRLSFRQRRRINESDRACRADAADGVGVLSQPALAKELKKKDKRVILLWLAGGSSQLETWDPKPGRPTGGPFFSIPTSVPGVQFCELMPKMAQRFGKYTSVVRSLNTKDGAHGRATQTMLRGRRDEPNVKYPDIGAILAREFGRPGSTVPENVSIYSPTEGRNFAKLTPSFLGSRFGAIKLAEKMELENIRPPKNLSAADHKARADLSELLNRDFAQGRESSAVSSHQTAYDRVPGLMSSNSLFDVSKEPAKVRARYGPTQFGQQALIARRLVEAGVPFVRVKDGKTGSVPIMHSLNAFNVIARAGKHSLITQDEIDQLWKSGRLLASVPTWSVLLMRYVLMAIGIPACLGLGYFVYQDSLSRVSVTKTPKKAEAVAVQVTRVQKRTILESVELIGRLEPIAAVTIRARIAGYLTRIPKDVGDQIDAGHLAVELDNSTHQQAVGRAEATSKIVAAQLKAARSRKNHAAREVARFESLTKKGGSTQQQLESAQAQFEIANAELELQQSRVDEADADVKRAKLALNETKIVSPLTGLIAERLVEVGDLANPNDPLVRIVELSKVRLVASVVEKDYQKVKRNQVVQVQVDAFPGELFTGRVARKSPVIEQDTQTAQVQIEIDNPGLRLRAGMTARARIILRKRERASVVPVASLLNRDDKRLAVDLMPDVTYPTISITTIYEGAGPDEIETLITRPMEQAAGAVHGVEQVLSSSMEGSSTVRLRFAWGTDIDSAIGDVRAKIESVRRTLPEQIDSPTIRRYDVSDFPVIYLGLKSNLPPVRLTQLAENSIAPRLENIDGVASIRIRGATRREIQVDIDRTKIEALNMSVAEVVAAIRRASVNQPAGDFQEGPYNLLVRSRGEFSSVRQISETVIRSLNGATVKVGDVARLVDGKERQRERTRVNGKPGLLLYVHKQDGANTVAVSDRVHQRVAEINSTLQNGALTVRIDKSDFIRQSIDNVLSSLLYGMLLAVLVLIVFLRSFLSTLVIAVSMPLSILATFVFIDFNGFTLNIVSFGGLALGIGLLVDNSIVVLESIFRKREDGLDPKAAAIEGTGEVASAIVASTLTTLVVFLPLLFIVGTTGVILHQLAWVVGVSLLCSLFASLTLTPVMTAYLIRAEQTDGLKAPRRMALIAWIHTANRWVFGRLEELYRRLLGVCLRYSTATGLLMFALFTASVGLAPRIGTEFLPKPDEGDLRITGQMAPGIQLDQLDGQATIVENAVLNNVKESRTMAVSIGDGADDADDWNECWFRLHLVPRSERTRSVEEIRKALGKNIGPVPGMRLRVQVRNEQMLSRMLRSGGGGGDIDVEIRGHDRATADELAREIERRMKKLKGLINVEIGGRDRRPELAAHVDRAKASLLGVSVSDITQTLETTIRGTDTTVFREDGNEFNVLVRLRESDRDRIDDVAAVGVPTSAGRIIPLKSVVNFAKARSPVTISRQDQQRVLLVSADVEDRDLGSIVRELQDELTAIKLPDGFSLNIAGDWEEQQRSFADLRLGFILAVLLMYMVMASQFESLKDPLLILVTIPLGAIGVIVMLVATGTTLNVQSFIGMVMLAGIVVNNAIVLIDYINQLRRAHPELPIGEIISRAGVRRFRPILMTTLTTVLAMLPIALGWGEGGELQAPMARVVIGGLISGTLITLVAIPLLARVTMSNRPAAE